MKKILVYIKLTLYSVILLSILLLFFLFYILWKFSPELPSYENIINYQPNLTSRIYSSDGLLLKSYYLEERIFIPINRVPNKIKEAFISAEDKKFYDHKGVDLIAILRAALTNLISISSNRRVVGASTITQQVVKNLLLTNELSYERKIKEILLAIRIENILTKEKILELYLNDIYLGFGSYGIGTASLNYFNKSINELSLDEIAFLAALPKAPNNYNPKTKYNNAIERRNWVLERMYKNGYLAEEDLEYKLRPIQIFKRTENFYNKADYYYEEIRKQLYKDYGKEKLYEEGLVVKTSINSKIQKFADQSLLEGLINYEKQFGWKGTIENVNFKTFVQKQNYYNQINPFNNVWLPVTVISKKNNQYLITKDEFKTEKKVDLKSNENLWLKDHNFNSGDVIFIEEKKNKKIIIRQIPEINGAIVVMNPHNGNVLALSGGYSFKISEFNRSTQARRQPGSAFKPFVYMTALEQGYTPSTLILDAPYVVDQGPGLPKWKPANYTEEFYGLTTMRTGIEKSRNLMTVRLANKIGMDKILITAEKFGINKDLTSQLSMSLGSGLVSLLEITNAYAMIANGGKKIKPNIISSIHSKNGSTIYKSTKTTCNGCKFSDIIHQIEIPNINKEVVNVIDPRITYQMTSMMEGVIKRGTAKKIKILNVPIAGKTGTTNDNKDTWFIGYTPNLVIGVYVGYDKPKNLGYKQTGSSVAVPIFKNLAKKININPNNIPFRIPSGISFVRIDSNTGMPSNKKNAILEPYILGSEPYNQKITILDNLGYNKNNSISGTGGLLK
tara:strand:- start:3010 stop:5370 length:2361 start_codon:yes stop_codon:yes gene_type:complete